MKASKIAKLLFFVIIFASVISLVCMNNSIVAVYTYQITDPTYVSVSFSNILNDVFGSFSWLFYVIVVLFSFSAFAFDNKLVSLASTVTSTAFICPVILKFFDYVQIFNNIKNNQGSMSLKNEFFVLLIMLIVIVVFNLIMAIIDVCNKEKRQIK